MKTTSLLLVLICIAIGPVKASIDTIQPIPEQLSLDIPLLDYPFVRYAAEAGLRRKLGKTADQTVAITAKDYLRSYENLSMQQSLAITTNLHSTNYFLQNKLWNKWLPVDRKNKRFLNRLGANATAGVVDYLLAYQLMIFSPVWLHEEFHRSGLTLQGIASHNDTYYRFGSRSDDAGGSVSEVQDGDLIRFKANDPSGFIRTHASGIESQYLLLRRLQSGNFFRKDHYPNAVMNILLTNAAVNYVNQFKQKDYDEIIDSMNVRGSNIPDRDYVGWDFTAWVYDLFRSDESYAQRGPHPLGNGINRIVKRAQLSGPEYDYLVRMGKMQYLNYLSPSMLGINQIKLSDQLSFNFAIRHILTSFGSDLSLDLFLDHRKQQWLISLHNYKNLSTDFAGIEVWRNNLLPRLGQQKIILDLRGMVWMQPKDQLFRTSDRETGGLLALKASSTISRRMQFYLDLEAKTDGWVAGSPFLDSALSARLGLSVDFSN